VCGHHAITSSAWDILIEDFDINAKWIHDLSLGKFARGVVHSNGKGVDMNMDHHKAQNYGCLWTQLEFGEYVGFSAAVGALERNQWRQPWLPLHHC
jgi:hypothetical protein